MIKKTCITTITILSTLLSLSAQADNKMEIQAGFAVDMGFGATALINKQFSIMVGNRGIAADYIFKQGRFNMDVPFTWYVAGGAYNEWDKGFGVRLPLGLNLNFEKNWNAYVQISPDLDFDDNAKFGAQFATGLRYHF
ncbi:hypothetical protein [Psychromonas antarctica]|jgi:hypothetical protein|uniref:hypothetical protein n=1 Tax=Psychromonas antarctica TaxID=67573 RepID=UPI001EE8CA9D|nr:hypothetical protein [Psychromonas antarctica]MCG6201460.1 hypothetical protein [Psychromonas antarctica]